MAHDVIPSDSVRAMLRSLRANAVIWYAPDRYDRDGALVPFFHELAMTTVATSKLVKIAGAPVVPFSYRRLRDWNPRYEIRVHAPLESFPSDDPVGDTRRLVAYLEEFIRLCPEQYQWVHKRFKGRPAELPDLYDNRGTAGAAR
jgi:KDO2-lipid IV(A) lauroyltransferase